MAFCFGFSSKRRCENSLCELIDYILLLLQIRLRHYTMKFGSSDLFCSSNFIEFFFGHYSDRVPLVLYFWCRLSGERL